MEWTYFTPVEHGVGPDGVSFDTHEIQSAFCGQWSSVLREHRWFPGIQYRYRLHIPDLTQLSDADMDAHAKAIEAERKRREDDLGEWLELLAKTFDAWAGERQAANIRSRLIEGAPYSEDKAAARILRDHTRRAVEEALKAAGHD